MSFSVYLVQLPFHSALEEMRWEGRSKEKKKNLEILKTSFSEMKNTFNTLEVFSMNSICDQESSYKERGVFTSFLSAPGFRRAC